MNRQFLFVFRLIGDGRLVDRDQYAIPVGSFGALYPEEKLTIRPIPETAADEPALGPFRFPFFFDSETERLQYLQDIRFACAQSHFLRSHTRPFRKPYVISFQRERLIAGLLQFISIEAAIQS